MPRAFLRFLPIMALMGSLLTPFTSSVALAQDDTREYVVIDLGVVDGGEYSIGNAINSRGVIVGMALAGGNSQAVMLDDLQFSVLGNGKDASSANDINRSGQVVGFVSSAETSGQRATLWQEGQQLDLGTLGGPFSIAHGINDRGDVVGEATIQDGVYSRGFLWRDGAMTDLGTLGGEFSVAMDINNDGLIAGLSTSEPGQTPYGPGTKAVLWGEDGMVDLGALGGDVAASADINEQGWVVGGATTEPGLEYGAPGTHAFIWKDGVMMDLGTLDGGDFSTANGVNKDGVVVGFSGDPNAVNPNNSMTATLWDEKGQIVNLNDVISDAAGWFLVTAIAINDNGQITGLGVFNGQYRGFLLDPKR